MVAWEPGQYLKYGEQRLRPAMDLLAHVPLESPGVVFDLGCGTGNVTRILAERWPEAEVSGVDSSPEMLSRARDGGGAIGWIEADLARWTSPMKADLVFSNAALHWLDDQRELFPRLLAMLKPGGVLAVQMPRNFDEPSHTIIGETARDGPWRLLLTPLLRPQPVAAPQAYFDMLAPLTRSVDIWETDYQQVFEGDNPVVEWIRGTSLKPLLDALDGEVRERFLADYSARIQAAYPKRADGKTLYSMRRLFIVAVK